MPYVIISLFALWLSPEETKDRVDLIFTELLTSVAYQFVIADNLFILSFEGRWILHA